MVPTLPSELHKRITAFEVATGVIDRGTADCAGGRLAGPERPTARDTSSLLVPSSLRRVLGCSPSNLPAKRFMLFPPEVGQLGTVFGLGFCVLARLVTAGPKHGTTDHLAEG